MAREQPFNGSVDLLSCPSLTIASTTFCTQAFQKVPELNSWSFFLPATESTLLLEQLLCYNAWQGNLSLPNSFGQFAATGSTAFFFNIPQARSNNTQMALYAIHLALGNTLFCWAIKAPPLLAPTTICETPPTFWRGSLLSTSAIRLTLLSYTT